MNADSLKNSVSQRLYPVEFCPEQEQPNSERTLLTTVEEKAARGDYQTAITILTQLIERNPHNASNYNNRGLMYSKNGQLSEAIADLSQAIEINPRLDNAYNNRANCYASQGNLAAALKDYEVALDFNPGNIRAWINQGIAFRQLGLYDLAIENFDLALALGKRLQGRIYAERGRSYHLRGDWNCAVADYQRSLAQESTSGQYNKNVEPWLQELLPPLTA
ncbi:MAG: tetratricopeptide repeat protein [Spirulinaceae cyanobacterium]